MSARCRSRGGGTGTAPGNKGGRGGKIAAGSIAATVIGAVIKDLSRPNSLIRGLVAMGREKLLARHTARPAVDVGDAVEVEIIDETMSGRESDISGDKQKEV